MAPRQDIGQVGSCAHPGRLYAHISRATLLLAALDAYYAKRSAEDAKRLKAFANGQLEIRSADLSRINGLLQQEVQVRAQAKQNLCEARDELESRVLERTADLVRTNESLQKQIGARKIVQEQALRLS